MRIGIRLLGFVLILTSVPLVALQQQEQQQDEQTAAMRAYNERFRKEQAARPSAETSYKNTKEYQRATPEERRRIDEAVAKVTEALKGLQGSPAKPSPSPRNDYHIPGIDNRGGLEERLKQLRDRGESGFTANYSTSLQQKAPEGETRKDSTSGRSASTTSGSETYWFNARCASEWPGWVSLCCIPYGSKQDCEKGSGGSCRSAPYVEQKRPKAGAAPAC